MPASAGDENDTGLHPEVELHGAGRGVHRFEALAVGGGEVDDAVADGGRRDHPAVVVVDVPLFFAGLRVDRVEVAVAAAEVHDASSHRRRARDADLVVDLGIVARLKAPEDGAGRGVQRVEVAVPAPDVDHPVHDRGRGVHHVARRELPLQGAGVGVDRIDMAVAAAEVDRAARDRAETRERRRTGRA